MRTWGKSQSCVGCSLGTGSMWGGAGGAPVESAGESKCRSLGPRGVWSGGGDVCRGETRDADSGGRGALGGESPDAEGLPVVRVRGLMEDVPLHRGWADPGSFNPPPCISIPH